MVDTSPDSAEGFPQYTLEQIVGFFRRVKSEPGISDQGLETDFLDENLIKKCDILMSAYDREGNFDAYHFRANLWGKYFTVPVKNDIEGGQRYIAKNSDWDDGTVL